MRGFVLSTLAVGLLSACTAIAPKGPVDPMDATGEGQPRPQARPETLDTSARPVPVAARTEEEFDTTTAEERRAAVTEAAAAGGEVALGTTVASLGSPTEPGFWLKTPLVSAREKGKVIYPGSGKSVAVDLIPIDGPKTAGSRMSLPAMRLIEAPLTGLPEVEVYRVSG